MTREIITQGIGFDTKGQWLETLYSDGSISVEPLSAEASAKWQAENKY